jgi:hypothetical protein
MRSPRLSGFVRRVRLQDEVRGHVVPEWTPLVLLACTVVLIPWTVLLVVELPDRQIARHWDLAWGGLDVSIAGGLAATALAVSRRSAWTPVLATITGTLLIVDAWFDVVTASGPHDRLIAVGMALLAELPLATVCFLIARNVERVLEQAARYALAAGYRVEGRSLVAPAAGTEDDPDPPGVVGGRTA